MSEKDLERIKNIYGKRNPKTHIEQRCQRLYTKQLETAYIKVYENYNENIKPETIRIN